ncbi:hypothetical protein CgunFtcFv8_002589 [Champsocephalus gunnari]|uniref:Uncharacterized protein n=1 Tax=Champsocephalus gunnari TaxID=52237 RepID=A0AAN8DH68_CHAGU|nr:hypothetical protein CgunFtcFv8_002589 [Champsocephalus gunnari]
METDCRMRRGREFQSLGAEQLKARAPMVLRRELGMVRSPTEEERRVREGVLLEEIPCTTVQTLLINHSRNDQMYTLYITDKKYV